MRRPWRWLDALLCWIGCHDWSQMDGECARPGCDALDGVWHRDY